MKSLSAMGWLVLAGVVLIAAGVGVFFLLPARHSTPSQETPTVPPPPDPRLTYSGPYQNIHPDVAYVGDAICAECHGDKAETYGRHPMGRTLVPIASALDLLRDGPKHNNPLQAFGSTFRVDKQGERVWQREIRNDDAGNVVYENAMEVHYMVGSGNHGHSFLCDRGGFVVQTPLSWFSSKDIWGMSPGWKTIGAGRPVMKQCLFCHSNRVEPVAGSVNRYAEPLFRGHAIGCERCHGPGAKHVAAWGGNGETPKGQDYTIVNPQKLPPDRREAVCQQCHLEGEYRLVRRGRELFDFRPGLALGDFWSIFVPDEHGANDKAVNHVEQMYASTCFKRSAGPKQMGCISCHDPHVKVAPEQRVSHYRASCLNCHEKKGCTVAEADRRKTSPSDSCIDCHMTRFPASDIDHTASTDHRVLRRPGKLAPHTAPGAEGGPPRLFHKSRLDAYDDEEQRDLGIAMGSLVQNRKLHPRHAQEAIRILDVVLERNPNDVEAWEGKGNANFALSRTGDALAAFEASVARSPEREAAVVSAAMLAQMLDRLDDSIGYWRRAAELNPWQPQYHANLATLLFVKRDMDGARSHGDQWLKLDPGNIDARKFWITYWLRAGDKEKAKAEFARIEAIKPPNLAELQNWFARLMR